MQALKVIFLIWTDPKKGLAKKRILQRDAFEGETYYEAIPSTAIYTCLLLSSFFLFGDDLGTPNEPQMYSLVGFDGNLFTVTYTTSILTASFGLAKALKTGPCKILPDGGLLSCRFLLLIFASLLTLLGKLFMVPLLATAGGSILLTFGLIFAFVLLPGLIIALVSTWHSKMVKTFLIHPSFFILPMFTYLTFSSSHKACCCGSSKDGVEESYIRFSVKASLCNTFLSFLMGSVVYFAIIATCAGVEWVDFSVFWIPSLLGFLLSVLFLCNARPTNNRFHFFCCCSMCCSCKAAMEYSIYKPDQPTKDFVLRIADDGSEEVLPADEWKVEVEQEVELMEQTQEEPRQEESNQEESSREGPGQEVTG